MTDQELLNPIDNENEQSSICLICDAVLPSTEPNYFDSRFGIEKFYSISECEKCHFVQLAPPPSAEELVNLYAEYYNYTGKRSKIFEGIREIMTTSPVSRIWAALDGDMSFHTEKGHGRLLDVGCNEGRALTQLEKNGFDVEGIELNEGAAKIAREKGHEVYVGTLEKFQPEKKFDVVVLSNVLEHVLSPKDVLTAANDILNPQGQIWITLPNVESFARRMFGKYWINWHIPFHISHFSQVNLKQILVNSGFGNVRTKQITPALWVSMSLISRLFAKPGKQTAQMRNPVLMAALVSLFRFILFPLLWIANKTGRGDCLVVKAKKATI